MSIVKRVYDWVTSAGNVIAGVFIAIIMLLTVGEIVGRYAFNHPISGSFEIIGVAMGVLTTIGFAFALQKNVHIRVTILADRFPPKVQRYMLLAVYFIGTIVTAVLSWQLVISAGKSLAIKEMVTGGAAYVPVYPTRTIMAFAMIIFCIGYLLISIEKTRRSNNKR